MKNIDKYLDMSDEQLDNLLLGVNLDNKFNIQLKTVCKNCKSPNLVIDNIKGYMVCTDCAVINEEYLDDNPEPIGNEGEFNNNSRYGAPSSFFCPKASLGTKITPKGGYYNRLIRLQKQGQMPYKEKSLMDVLETIQSKCKKYGITQSIIDSAKILYKKVSESVHSKGKRIGKNIIMRCINRRSMIAACLFHACKLQKETRSPKEVADIYDLEIKHVNRGCRKFCDMIDSNTLFYQIKSSQSFDFIKRFAKKLNIDEKYIDIAKDVSSNIHRLDLASTHEPPSVAAGCILLVTQYYNIQLSKKQISDIFGISDVTISKTFRKIWPYHKIVLSNKITELILEKENSITINDSELNKSNLIINQESDSEEKPIKKTIKNNKKNYLINEDSDENNSNNEFYETDESDETDDTDDIDETDETNKIKNKIEIEI
jgi:transcription initiation factor TFIIIB Brf1 subunit/transcription initiation factor TFIIB